MPDSGYDTGETVLAIQTPSAERSRFVEISDSDRMEAWSWEIKTAGRLAPPDAYEAIEMPRNNPTGILTALFSTITGFAMVWHIWWMVVLGLMAAYAAFVWFAWRDEFEYEIPAAEVERVDAIRRRTRAEWIASNPILDGVTR